MIIKNELVQIIANTKNYKSYGPDKISYEFHKNVTQKILNIILKQMNISWTRGDYPQDF